MQPDLFSADRDDLDLVVPSQRTSHASRQAAETLTARRVQGPKLRRLLAAYQHAGAHGCTDSELEAATGIPRQSICSLKASAKRRGWIEAIGEREGQYPGFFQTVHRLTPSGREIIVWTTK